ncbi:MAG TPA: hypothetical protein VF215_16745 [Thermoanaerobaculia bacterium]
MQTEHSSRRWFVLFLSAVLSFAASAQPDLRQWVRSAPLIFRGTNLGTMESPTLPLPPPRGRAFRVRVDETLRGAESIGDFTQQEIVVMTAGGDNARKTAIYFVRPVVYGKTLVAEELGEMDVPSDKRAFANALAQAEQQNADAVLSERIASAEAVVVARVLDVRSVVKERGGRPSEHDPEWAIARLAIVRTLKGQPRTAACAGVPCVEVAFAQSDDIRWFRAPKLVPGQEAIVFLRPADEKLLREGEKPPARYVIVDPLDVLPVREEPRLIRLIRALR